MSHNLPGASVRILFVNPYYKPYLGGIERIIEQVSHHLLDYPDVEAIGLLTTRAHFPDRMMSELPAREQLDGIEIYRCTLRPIWLPRIFHPAMAGYFGFDVFKALRAFQPDIIHFMYSEWWSANLAIYLATWRTPHVLFAAFHNWPVTKRTLPLYTVNRWLGQRLDAVQVMTEIERTQVHQAYRVPLDRTTLTPPGVDIPDTIPDRSTRERLTILAVGRLSEHKGQIPLVQIVQQIAQEYPQIPFRLVLAGGDGGMQEKITDFIHQHQLTDRVEILGYCTDNQLRQLYSEADIFALPTKTESFGIVFIEALAYGVPVVTYAVGPVPDVLTQGALLIALGDEQGFKEALVRLLQDQNLRQQFGTTGREMVRQKYSWQATTEKLHRLYTQLIATHSSSRRRLPAR
jgi:glycosyltransferase involved in cell wall biosynthesis